MASSSDEMRANVPQLASLLRHWRLAAGLSQEALAERAGLSVNGIAQIETGKRTAPRASTLQMLAAALELSDDQRRALARSARPGAESPLPEQPPAPSPAIQTALPNAPTPLVGRVAEIAEITRLLRDGGPPLITLTGPGGVGKTRLALAVASGWRAGPAPDATAWVELASLAMPALVPGAVARAAGIPDNPGRPITDTLVDALREQRLLIVLDNCEHLLPAVRTLAARLLAHCPEVRILASSRSPLRLSGERLYPVTPLALPDPHHIPPLDELASFEAIALFTHRARAARRDFTLTDRNADAVVDICTRLDGLPLALELAAARLRVLSPAALQGLLEQRLRLLVGGPADAHARHQTLRAAVEWSHDLLTAHQQRVFRHLGVFAGGSDLDALAAVAGIDDPLGVLDAVEGLVDQSMLIRTELPDGAVRLGMLETFRTYALEQLDLHGETEEARYSHAAWFLTLAESMQGLIDGPRHAAAISCLEAEHANLLHALAWLADRGDAGCALRLASAMMPWWNAAALLSEANTWLERALAVGDATGPTAARATALVAAGQSALLAGDFDRARSRLEDGIAMARAHRARDAEIHGLYWLGCAAMFGGALDEGRAHAKRSLALARETNAPRHAAAALWSLGFIAMAQGDHDAARRQLTESLALAREAGTSTLIAFVQCELANLDYRGGHLATAHERAADALEVGRHMSHRGTTGQALGLLAEIARARGDWDGALRYAEEDVAALRPSGMGIQLAWALRNLGYAAMETGATAEAAGLFAESLTMFRDQRATLGIASSIVGIATIAARTERPDLAARLVVAVEATLEDEGLAFAPADAMALERVAANFRADRPRARADSDAGIHIQAGIEDAIAEALALGRKMSSQQPTIARLPRHAAEQG